MFITLGILLAAANKPDAPMPSMLVMKNLFTLVPTHQKMAFGINGTEYSNIFLRTRQSRSLLGRATYSQEPPNMRYRTTAINPPKIKETKYPSTFQPSNQISKPAEDADARDDAMDAQVMSFIWFKPRATFAKYALNADETKYAR